MKTRVVLFGRHPSTGMLWFGLTGPSLALDLPGTIAGFALANHFVRSERFDWEVGDAGARAVLLEAVADAETSLFPSHIKFQLGNETVTPAAVPCSWHLFPAAAKILTEGRDRNLLQLTVQFLTAGATLDELAAAIVDDALLAKMRDAFGPDATAPDPRDPLKPSLN